LGASINRPFSFSVEVGGNRNIIGVFAGETLPASGLDPLKDVLTPVVASALAAGEAIMASFRKPMRFRYKPDGSPVTEADEAAEAIILRGLASISPDIPIVSEETVATAVEEGAQEATAFYLVDPLDGTRAFLSGDDEFTVNIALVRGGFPCLGVIYAPAQKLCFFAVEGQGAWQLTITETNAAPDTARATRLSGAPHPEARGRIALVSPTRYSRRDRALVEGFQPIRAVPVASSLKFTMLAQGLGDIYPRFGATSTWDSAAGQVILEEAGGAVLTEDGKRLSYALDGQYLNPDFVAWRRYPLER
jgi:3'(2'), 5'-bisphosphate nucleotidase